MSKALRGDFERLRERGVSLTLTPRETAPPEPKHVEPTGPVVETTTEPEVEPPEAQAAELEPEPAPERETAVETEASAEPSEPGWLGRLFGR